MAGGIETIELSDGWPARLWRGGEGASFIFLQGRADFLEKHVPFFEDLAQAGFAVLAPEWRGQGLSGRKLDNPHKGHIDSFDTYLDDLAFIIAGRREPYHIGGFSMGGHLALRHYLERADRRLVRSLALISPMLGIRTAPFPGWLARRLAGRRVRSGRAGEYVPGRGDYRPISEDHRRRLTGDAEAYRRVERHMAENKALALGGPTYGWLMAAIHSQDSLMGAIGQENLAAWPPVLMQLPGRDRLVSSSAARRLAGLIGDCRLITYEGAEHDLLIEQPSIRRRVLDDLIRFLNKNA